MSTDLWAVLAVRQLLDRCKAAVAQRVALQRVRMQLAQRAIERAEKCPGRKQE